MMSNPIELNFREFLEHVGAPALFGDFSSPQHALTALLPSVTKTAKIRYVERNKNPIFVLLADGTKLYLTWDEFRRIPGPKPEVGKSLTVVFQRNEMDRTSGPSQITSILCH